MFRSCLGVYHPDCHLVDVPPNTTHEEARIELRALIPLKLLGTDSDIVIAWRAAGLPSDVLWALGTDLCAISGQPHINQIHPRLGTFSKPVGRSVDWAHVAVG